MNYSTIHLPIRTLTQRVENMKQMHSYLKNDHINNDLDHIIDELKTITREIIVDRTNTLEGYNKAEADLFLGRNLDDYEWQELKDTMLDNSYIWGQVGEYATDWITDNIIGNEEE